MATRKNRSNRRKIRRTIKRGGWNPLKSFGNALPQLKQGLERRATNILTIGKQGLSGKLGHRMPTQGEQNIQLKRARDNLYTKRATLQARQKQEQTNLRARHLKEENDLVNQLKQLNSIPKVPPPPPLQAPLQAPFQAPLQAPVQTPVQTPVQAFLPPSPQTSPLNGVRTTVNQLMKTPGMNAQTTAKLAAVLKTLNGS